MSIQPLKPVNKYNVEPNEWESLAQLAEQLLHQPDLLSLIIHIIEINETIFSCKVNLWLSDTFNDLFEKEEIPGQFVDVNRLNELIVRARDQNNLISINSDNQSTNDLQPVVTFPLAYNSEVLAVISLERNHQLGFNPKEFSRIIYLAHIASSSLYTKKIQLDYLRQQTKNTQHDLIIQINRSITSILDLNHLINSTVTLIHQNFDFFKISLFIEKYKNILFRISISKKGIETEEKFSLTHDDHPLAWVLHNKETLVINDTSLEGRFIPTPFEDQTRSELLIPLVSSEDLLGVLVLSSEHVNEFKPDVVDNFCYLAESISLAIRNAMIFKTEQLKTSIAERINKIIASISADIPFEDIIYGLLSEVNGFIPFDSSAVWMVDDAADDIGIGQFTSSIKLAAVKINNPPTSTNLTSLAEYSSSIKKDLLKISDSDIDILSQFPWMGEVLNSHQPVICDLEKTNEPLGQIQGYPERYSALGLPLISNNKTIGIIIICNQNPDQFLQDSLLAADIITDYAASVIDKAMLFAATHEQMWTSTVLLQISETSQVMSSLNELFDSVGGMLNNLIGIQSCVFYLLDQSETILYPQASLGFSEEQQARLNEWTIYSGSIDAFDEMMLSRNPVIFSPQSLSSEIVSLIFPDYDLDIDLLILFPMISHDIVIGALLVDFAGTKLQMDSSQKDWDEMYTILQGATDQIAVNIQNLQITKSREEEAYISVALLQVAQAIVSLNSLDEILSSIVRITPILVGVKRCIIYLWDDERSSFRASQFYGINKNELLFEDKLFKANEFPFIEFISQENQIAFFALGAESSPSTWSDILIPDIRIIEGDSLDGQSGTGFTLNPLNINEKQHLLIGFPLTIIGDVLGVMLIEEEEPIKGIPSSHIREKRIEIVNGITRQTAIAIKNDLLRQEAVKSERMERELQLAREIQKTFLPDHIPTISGWDVDARWQPAREVGGDFYDILQLDHDHLGFVIADVADKGMPAALFMTLIRTLIRAAARDNLSPAMVLKQVNDLLLQDAKNGMFVTVFYAVIDIHSGIVTYANSGHNPPIVKHVDQVQLSELTRTSMALGIFPDIEVDERKIQLTNGDIMFLYTDGVTEAFSQSDEMYGTDRLHELIIKNKYLTSKELLDAVDISINEFVQGIPLQDDITVAVIHRIDY